MSLRPQDINTITSWDSRASPKRPESEAVSDLSSKARRISVVLRSPSKGNLASGAVTESGTSWRRGSDASEELPRAAPSALEGEAPPPASKLQRLILQGFHWICAGRDILEERPGWTVEEKHQWQSRALAGLLSGLMTAVISICFSVLYYASGVPITGTMPLAYALAMLLLFSLLRMCNSTRMVSLELGIDYFNRGHIFLVLVSPLVTDLTLGGAAWGFSSDTIIWSLLAPVAHLFCQEQSKQIIGSCTGGMSCDGVFSSLSHSWVPVLGFRTLFTLVSVIVSPWTEPTCGSSCPNQGVVTGIYIMNHTTCPLVITFILRQTMVQFLQRRAEIIRLAEALCRKLLHIEGLVRSLVPEFRVTSVIHHEIAPSLWHTVSQDSFSNCTILQMDVVEFTTLASSIDAEEVIDLINALFTSIDHVAACIGNVWKVETIGDCYIAVLGGPNPCKDHADKAVTLGTCILENARRISRKTVDLRVRIGIHSGDIMAGFIGSSLPRYLIYGEACEVVRKLESSGKPGMLHISEVTANQLSKTWRLTPHTGVDLPTGESIYSHLLDMKINFVPVRKAWNKYPSLNDFESWFCATSFRMKVPPPDESENGDQEAEPGAHRARKGNLNLPMRGSFLLVSALHSPDAAGMAKLDPDSDALINGSDAPFPEKEEPAIHGMEGLTLDTRRSESQGSRVTELQRLATIPSTPERVGSSPSVKPTLEILNDDGFDREAFERAKSEAEDAKAEANQAAADAAEARGLVAEGRRAPVPTPVTTNSTVTPPTPAVGDVMSQSFIARSKSVDCEWSGDGLTPLHIGYKNKTWSGNDNEHPGKEMFVRHASDSSSTIRSKAGKLGLWIDVNAPTSPETNGAAVPPKAPKAGAELKEALANIASKMDRTASWLPLRSPTLRIDDADLAGGQRAPRYWQESLAQIVQDLQLSPNSNGSNPAVLPTSGPEIPMRTLSDPSHDPSRWNQPASTQIPPTPGGRRSSAVSESVSHTPESLSLLTNYWNHNEAPEASNQMHIEIPNGSDSMPHTSSHPLSPEGTGPDGLGAEGAPASSEEVSEMQLKIWSAQVAADSMRSSLHQHVIAYFLAFCGLSASIQSAVMLSTPWWSTEEYELEDDGSPYTTQQLYGISPGVFAVIALSVACHSFSNKLDGSSQHHSRVAVQVLLFIAPAVMAGGFDGIHSRVAVLWAYCAVVLQCNFSAKESHSWKWLTLAYCGLVIVFHLLIDDKIESGKVPGWIMFLHVLNHIVPTTMSLLPFILTVHHLESDEERDEELLRQKQGQVDLENQLLEALMPQSIALKLRDANGELIADRYENTSVLFIYVADYEALLFQFGPEKMIQWLNEIFCKFDDLLRVKFRDKIFKMETFSSFYLAVSGCPEKCHDHAQACTVAAVKLMELATSVIRPDGLPTSIRVGLSSGPVCAGVVGNTGSPRFSIFGDTVNTASRMASNAEVSTATKRYVHLSESSALLVDGTFIEGVCQQTGLLFGARGLLSIKGKGEMTTYTLTDPEEA